MDRIVITLVVALFAASGPARAAEQNTAAQGHYLLVWAGDRAQKGNDFLAVIDADPSSASYGRMMTPLARTSRPCACITRNTRCRRAACCSPTIMTSAGRSSSTCAIRCSRRSRPRSPTWAATCIRTRSCACRMATCSPRSSMRITTSACGTAGKTGGLVEIDDSGKVVRSASNADPAFPEPADALWPGGAAGARSRRVHEFLDARRGPVQRGDVPGLAPVGPQAAEDGVPRCRRESLRAHQPGRAAPRAGWIGVRADAGLWRGAHHRQSIPRAPKSQLVYTFPGNWCGVPTIVGHYFVQSVPAIHGLIVLDMADPAKPVEVSRLTLSERYFPHWTGWDAETGRLVVTSGHTPEDRPVPAEAGSGNRRAHGGQGLSGRGRSAGLQFRGARLAAWLAGCGHTTRSRVHSLIITVPMV